MTQGVFVNGQRPKSKKAIREALANGDRVSLEATSIFGNEYGGPVENAPDGTYYIVGPDPYTKRSFYGTITVSGGAVKIK